MCVRRIQLEVFRTSSRATTVCRRPSRAFACDSRLQLGGGVCVSAGGCPVGVNQARATVLVAGESTKPTRESLLPRLSFPRSAASQRDGLRDVGHLDVGVEGGRGAQVRRDALPRVDGAQRAPQECCEALTRASCCNGHCPRCEHSVEAPNLHLHIVPGNPCRMRTRWRRRSGRSTSSSRARLVRSPTERPVALLTC